MFGKSRIEADANTQGKANAKPNGAMMLLKSMGFDPQEFMDTINGARGEYELAKTASIQTVIHFNARLDVIEKRLEILSIRLDNLLQVVQIQEQMFSSVMSSLKVTTEHDPTKPNTTGGAVPEVVEDRVAAGRIVED